jgi:hypothetical protein
VVVVRLTPLWNRSWMSSSCIMVSSSFVENLHLAEKESAFVIASIGKLSHHMTWLSLEVFVNHGKMRLRYSVLNVLLRWMIVICCFACRDAYSDQERNCRSSGVFIASLSSEMTTSVSVWLA